jgi:hypothetical protein
MLERQLSSIKQMAVDPTFGTAIRPPFEVVALVLQGGGALGAYQAGVTRRSPRQAFIPTGLPACRSVRPMRLLSLETRRARESVVCGSSGVK